MLYPLKHYNTSSHLNMFTIVIMDQSLNAVFKNLFHLQMGLGVYIPRYAASIDDILEEEEHYADQLKEYLFYTEAVR